MGITSVHLNKLLIHFLKFLVIAFLVVFGIASLVLVGRALIHRPKIHLESISKIENFASPVNAVPIPGEPKKWAVVEKRGTIQFFDENTQTKEKVLDISYKVFNNGEEGMLSMVFSPQFTEDGHIFVFYSLSDPYRSHLSRFSRNENGKFELNSELIILEIPKPFTGHNGGCLKFDRGGMLMVSVGDGAGKLTQKRKDDMTYGRDIYGTILRIDVSHASKNTPYQIPKDNPFYGNDQGVRPEIWAYGFRNPWRFNFDQDSSRIWVSDVGDNTHEEIDLATGGQHYGWPVLEGALCRSSEQECAKKRYQKPHTYFHRNVTRSITGVARYMGSNVPSLKGKVLFSDFTRAIYAVNLENKFKYIESRLSSDLDILHFKFPTMSGKNQGDHMQIVSLEQLEDGEIVAVNMEGGVYRIRELSFYENLTGFLYMLLDFK